MKAFEIGDFRMIACFHQGVESRLDQFGHPSTEDALFSEKVGLGLLSERGFNDAGTGGPKTFGVGESSLFCLFCIILIDGKKGWDSCSLLVFPSHQMSRAFRSNHHHVDLFRRDDLAVMNVEPVRE